MTFLESGDLPSRLAWTFVLLTLGPSVSVTPLLAQQVATVSGLVVDAESGEPIPGVEVRVDGTNLMTVSDDDGSFQLSGVPRGSQRLLLRHIAYGEHERTLVLEEGARLEYEIRMSREAIELEPLEVQVRSEAERARLASGNSIDIVERPTIDLFDRQGGNLVNLLGREVRGIRINGSCVEYRFQANSGGIGQPDSGDAVNATCRQPAIYLDGVKVSAGLGAFALGELESVEVLSPSEAGIRYGMDGAYGVIELTSRQGFAPQFEPERVKLTGFEWYDEEPYPWAKTLGTSLVVNAAAAALNLGVFIDCSAPKDEVDPRGKCNSTLAAGAGLVTGTLSGLLTRWAGTSSLTQGRMFPSLVAGSVSATSSYMLVVHAEKAESDAGRVAGLALATAGTAILTTLTDRVFRMVR